jgi:hypothetical protein
MLHGLQFRTFVKILATAWVFTLFFAFAGLLIYIYLSPGHELMVSLDFLGEGLVEFVLTLVFIPLALWVFGDYTNHLVNED